jgi:hypothetical protein
MRHGVTATAGDRPATTLPRALLEGGSRRAESSESEPNCSMTSAAACLRVLAFASRACRTARALAFSASFGSWLRILTVEGACGALPSAKFSLFIATCVSFCVLLT